MSIKIKDWDELKNIPNESETHILKVSEHSAWLKVKNEKPYDRDKDFMEQVHHLDIYLSTHAFYKEYYKGSSELLQACGFDVELSNWDEEE